MFINVEKPNFCMKGQLDKVVFVIVMLFFAGLIGSVILNNMPNIQQNLNDCNKNVEAWKTLSDANYSNWQTCEGNLRDCRGNLSECKANLTNCMKDKDELIANLTNCTENLNKERNLTAQLQSKADGLRIGWPPSTQVYVVGFSSFFSYILLVFVSMRLKLGLFEVSPNDKWGWKRAIAFALVVLVISGVLEMIFGL